MTILSPLDSVYSNRDISLSSAPFSRVKRDCVFMAKAFPDESVLRNFDSRDGALATHFPISTAFPGLPFKQMRKPSKCSGHDVFHAASFPALPIPFNILSIK